VRILIAPVMQGKSWHGGSVYTDSLGGSEAAVVYIARGLVRKGAQVVVLSPGQPGNYDGVEYRHGTQLGQCLAEQWDVVVASRWIEVLEQPWNTPYRVLWLHDMPQFGVNIAANAVFSISEFQGRAWHLPPQAEWRTRNGVDPSVFYFDPREVRDPNMLVWASNPDRGLPLAAKIFQQARLRWPDLELHVYGRSAIYGWAPETETPYLPLPEHMEHVYMHEPLPRPKLAAVFRQAHALWYPTYWPETFCITAMEAQACGLPVLCSPEGALSETVVGGIVSNDFLNSLSQLRNYNRWQRLSQDGKEHSRGYHWDDIAGEWLQFFESRFQQSVDPAPVGVLGDQLPGAENVVSEMVGEAVPAPQESA